MWRDTVIDMTWIHDSSDLWTCGVFPLGGKILTTTFNNKSPLPWQPVAIFRPFVRVHSLLSIQKISGGGRPGGGLHGRISEEPSVTRIGSRTSLGHRGASDGRHKKVRKLKTGKTEGRAGGGKGVLTRDTEQDFVGQSHS